jgi:hypothetical protein
MALSAAQAGRGVQGWLSYGAKDLSNRRNTAHRAIGTRLTNFMPCLTGQPSRLHSSGAHIVKHSPSPS